MPRTVPDPPIGPVLRTIRVERGFSQEELAARSRLHRNYIGGVERDERNPSIRNVAKMLHALGITWAEFGRRMDDHNTNAREHDTSPI